MSGLISSVKLAGAGHDPEVVRVRHWWFIWKVNVEEVLTVEPGKMLRGLSF